MVFVRWLTRPLLKIMVLGVVGVYVLAISYCKTVESPEDCIVCAHGIFSNISEYIFNSSCGLIPSSSFGYSSTNQQLSLDKTPSTAMQVQTVSFTEFKNQLTPEAHTDLRRFMARSCTGCETDDDWHPYRGSCLNFPNLAAFSTGARVIWTKNTKGCDDIPEVNKIQQLSKELETSAYQIDRILMDNVSPGNAWAFRGSGKVLIKLSLPALIIGFTIHHPPKAILFPGYFASAPKDLQLYGLTKETDENSFLFGNFQYSVEGLSAQTFMVTNFSTSAFTHARLEILSNHGNPAFTTLYRVEIHGIVPNEPWFLAGRRKGIDCTKQEDLKTCLQ